MLKKPSQHQARKMLIEILYKHILLFEEQEVSLQYALDYYPKLTNSWIKILKGILKNSKILSEKISIFLDINWSWNRIGTIEQAILYLACYELQYTKTPANIIINEAINLDKEYSPGKSYRLINKVLDKMIKENK